MGRIRTTIIKEDIETLKSLYKKELNSRVKLRIKCLIYTKSNKYSTQTILATHLGVNPATVLRWLKQYREEGLESVISLKHKGCPRSKISKLIHDELAIKLNSSTDLFRGYWDVQNWVNNKFNEQIEYNTIRTYLIRHFKTKLKSPRKSHYKKDEQAIEAFFKTS
jgi:transposase